MESFNLGKHVPKSLDCRHAVCTECVMKPCGPPLERCPLCRQYIKRRAALPNDLSIIAYLDKKKQKRYIKERKETIESFIDQILEATQDVHGCLKEETVPAAQTLEERSAIYTSHVKHLFEQCQQRCNSKHFLSDSVMKNRKKLEETLHELQTSMANCTSLLGKPRVTMDQIDRCESEAMDAVKKSRDSVKSGARERATWHSYRIRLINTFTDISREPPPNNSNCIAGN